MEALPNTRYLELARCDKPWMARKTLANGKRVARRGYTPEDALARLDAIDHLDFPAPLAPVERKRLAPRGDGLGHKEGFPDRFKRAIKARDGRCVGNGRYWADCDGSYPLEYCQVDHIDPDGPHSMENGQTLCQNCHGVKCAEERAAGRDLDWQAA